MIKDLFERSFLKSADTGNIDSEDKTFLITCPVRSENLIASIKETGVASPIILREKGSRYQIVSGFRRVAACRELGIKTVRAFVFPEKRLADKEAFCLNLFENHSGRSFNAVEKAMILNTLLKRLKIDKNEYNKKFLPVIGIALNKKENETLFRVLGLDETIKAYIAGEDISLKNTLLWMSLSGKEEEVFRLIKGLKLSSNKMREVFTFLQEISRRDRVTIKTIVDCPEIQTVLNDENLSLPEKTSKVRAVLKRGRFPRLTSMEESFAKRVKGLKLPKGVMLRPPAFFEEEEFTIEFRIKNQKELKKISRSLVDLSDKEEVSDLFRTD